MNAKAKATYKFADRHELVADIARCEAKRQEKLQELIPLYAGKDRDYIKADMIETFASAAGITLNAKMEWPKADPRTKSCKRQFNRLLEDILAGESGRADPEDDKPEEIEIPEEILAAARKLAKLASEYEGARSLASKAVALAFAK